MLPIKEIENLVKRETKSVSSVAHDFDHLKRTAIGARWFAKISGAIKHKQDLAYLAGLVHDINRPLTEKIEHKDISKREAENLLNKFQINKQDKDIILNLIKMHRETTNETVFNQSVFLADKILEQMGAYNTIRRCVFVGELEDYKNTPFRKAIITQFTWRMKKFNPSAFPKSFEKLVVYQYNWQVRFINAFKLGEKWAVIFARFAYDNGMSHKLSLVEVFKKYRPISKKDAEYKKEALAYIKGKKFKEFEDMITEGMINR